MNRSHLEELLYQAIETELGGERLYEVAVESAMNEDFKAELQKYLEETRTHQEILGRVFDAAGLDIGTDTPGARWFDREASPWSPVSPPPKRQATPRSPSWSPPIR